MHLPGTLEQRTELQVGAKRDKLAGSSSEGNRSRIFMVLQLDFPHQLGENSPEGAEPRPLLLVPDVPHGADLIWTIKQKEDLHQGPV